MNDFVSLKIMEVLQRDHRGRENAAPRAIIENKLRVWSIDIGDRKIRDAYSHLPLCSCEYGLFRPIRPAEVIEYAEYLRRKHMDEALIQIKIRRILATWPELSPVPAHLQQSLF
jgi:hypothetical protein